MKNDDDDGTRAYLLRVLRTQRQHCRCCLALNGDVFALVIHGEDGYRKIGGPWASIEVADASRGDGIVRELNEAEGINLDEQREITRSTMQTLQDK